MKNKQKLWRRCAHAARLEFEAKGVTGVRFGRSIKAHYESTRWKPTATILMQNLLLKVGLWPSAVEGAQP